MDQTFFPPECFRRKEDGYLFFLAYLAFPDPDGTKKRLKLIHDMRLFITKSMVSSGLWQKEDCHRLYFRSPRRRETDLTQVSNRIKHFIGYQLQDRFDAASWYLGKEHFGSLDVTIKESIRFRLGLDLDAWDQLPDHYRASMFRLRMEAKRKNDRFRSGMNQNPEHLTTNLVNLVFVKSKPVLHMALTLKSILYHEIVDEDIHSPTRNLIIQSQQLGRSLGISYPMDLLFTDKWLSGALLLSWDWQKILSKQILSKEFPEEASKFIPVV